MLCLHWNWVGAFLAILILFFLVPLGPLLGLIQQKERFTEREASMVTREVALALSFLHRNGDHTHTHTQTHTHTHTHQATPHHFLKAHYFFYLITTGIAHRDLKPDNILCERDDQVTDTIHTCTCSCKLVSHVGWWRSKQGGLSWQ